MDASKYDLTNVLSQHLDKHLVFPLLEFLHVKGIYPQKEVLESKLALLKRTNMVDYAADVHSAITGDKNVPEDLKKRRAEVVAQ